jgi:hypothetical protein
MVSWGSKVGIFAFRLKLDDISGTWDLEPHVNRPLCIEWSRAITLVCESARRRREVGPLHTRDWEPGTITLQALSLVKKTEPIQVHFTLRSRDQRSNMRMQDGCKVYMDSYKASNGSRFTVTHTTFNNHLSEVGLTQNRTITTLRTLTTVDVFSFIIHKDPTWT